MWWLPQIIGYSYPRVAVIRIDVHPTGENPTNMTHTLPTGGPCTWKPSMSHRQSWTESLLLRKRAPDIIHSTSADRSTGPYSVSLSSQPMKQWRKPNIHQQQATRFTGPISSASDHYVQYLLTGVNRTVLNRHRQELQPWRCRLATYPLSNLPNQLSPLSPSGPARSLI
jgi:hypothetical protein